MQCSISFIPEGFFRNKLKRFPKKDTITGEEKVRGWEEGSGKVIKVNGEEIRVERKTNMPTINYFVSCS